ncbi:hypothetical protein CARUB_v10002399mg [Capsella rubella]|uniref:Uncharacterized protein n=1 Tax=Capsella rubella TaxID=81985 RepID=R0FIP3_9BRAS|nr:hypothetical protein CARUB_v10002399mg [Capsella rubella]
MFYRVKMSRKGNFRKSVRGRAIGRSDRIGWIRIYPLDVCADIVWRYERRTVVENVSRLIICGGELI